LEEDKMIELGNVPARDWLAVAIGLAGFALSYLGSRDRLPKWARKWLARIGRDRIEDAIEYAARLGVMSPEERRAEAVGYLVRLSERELGFPIPGSVANLLVEFVYQQWKRKAA
jgi:hypothetical protein